MISGRHALVELIVALVVFTGLLGAEAAHGDQIEDPTDRATETGAAVRGEDLAAQTSPLRRTQIGDDIDGYVPGEPGKHHPPSDFIKEEPRSAYYYSYYSSHPAPEVPGMPLKRPSLLEMLLPHKKPLLTGAAPVQHRPRVWKPGEHMFKPAKYPFPMGRPIKPPIKAPCVGHINYVIITTQRSGSHFMVEMLKSHPKVNTEFEMLSEIHSTGAKNSKIRKFFARKDDSHVYGFKAVSQEQWDGVGKALQELNVRVIFLWRRNKLRHLVSKLANRKVAAHPKENKLDQVRKFLPELPVGSDFDEAIKMWTDEEAKAEEQFGKMPNMHVYYEDIVATNPHCENTWRQIQEFLCLEPRKLTTKFPAIHQFEKVQDTIKNWDEVKRYLETKPKYRGYLQESMSAGRGSNPACGG